MHIPQVITDKFLQCDVRKSDVGIDSSKNVTASTRNVK